MESFENRKSRIRSELNIQLEALEDILAEELTTKLSRNEQEFAAERQRYVQDIDALRTKVAGGHKLEKENRELRAENDSLRLRNGGACCRPASSGDSNTELKCGSNVRTIKIEEYDRVKGLLAEAEKDYGKAAWAHRVLELKLRHYKEVTKQWREYTDRWILKHSNNGLRSHAVETPEVRPVGETRTSRYSSAPAPPSIPDGLIASLTDMSRSLSPSSNLARTEDPRWSPSSRTHQPASTLPPVDRQSALEDHSRALSGDVTEASDESEQAPSQALEGRSRNVFEGEGKTAAGQAQDGGSSPVVVAERSVKRKRSSKVYKDSARPKSPTIKHEQPSSGQLNVTTSTQSRDIHDSLDLDDVEGHIDTPRKRQRVEQLRLLSSPELPSVQQHDLKIGDVMDTGVQHDVPIENGSGKETASAVRLVVKQQNLSVDEQQHQSRKASSKAQQQAHNNRVNERLDLIDKSAGDDHLTKAKAAGHPNKITMKQSRSSVPKTYYTPVPESPVHSRTPQGHRRTEMRRSSVTSPVILQPTDPNVQVLPRTHEKLIKHKPSCPPFRRDRSAAHVHAVAEDGEDLASFSGNPIMKQANAGVSPEAMTRASDLHHRLGALLSEPSPAKPSVPIESEILSPLHNTTSKPPLRNHDRYTSSDAPITPQNLPAQKTTTYALQNDQRSPQDCKTVKTARRDRAPKVQATGQRQSTRLTSHDLPGLPQSDEPADPRPEEEPLRARPIHRLGIRDFKLNSAHSDYHYNVSVRKHDEKKRLSGCTDRNCSRCHDLRKFVESSGYTRVPGQNEEETNRALLETYLGKDRGRLKDMSTDEKEELLIQAKVQQFVDLNGKHRTPFQRAQSPVDFWNVGFPSTQEHQQNLQAVREREREKVKEMYWEALRDRGRYIFADE